MTMVHSFPCRAALGAAFLLAAALVLLLPPAAQAQTAGVVVSKSDIALKESFAGSTHSYLVTLASRPAHDVTVTATSPDATQVEVAKSLNGPFGATATLTFTPSNWSRWQPVLLRRGSASKADNVDEPDRSYEIAHAVASTDTSYDGIGVRAVIAKLIDDDPTRVTLSAPPGDIPANGSTKTLTVSLGRSLVDGEALRLKLSFVSAVDTKYTVSCGSAAEGVSCSKNPNNILAITFTGGAGTSRTATTTLTEVDDGKDGSTSVHVRLAKLRSGTGQDIDTLINPNWVRINISRDRKSWPAVTFSSTSYTSYTASEGSAAMPEVALSKAVERDVTVTVATPVVQAGHGLQNKPDTWFTSPAGLPVDATAGPG